MFERFTQPARDAVIRAQAEARDLGQSPIGTQHVLLAMLADETGPIAALVRDAGVDARSVRAEIIRRATPDQQTPPPADTDAEDAAALRSIGIDLDAVRSAIEENFGPGALRLPRDAEPPRRGPMARLFSAGHIPFSPRAKKVLELSLREAIRLKHKYIAAEHILLGVLREGDGMAAAILADAGVDFDRLRADLTASLRDRAA
ncbi:Clp protease [Mangrovihabitans endophyticus]|uniref:Clp protease n=1 Tax=Mangrovihabitans endophyticus TaxID=1751298 RepID=A0A8J3BWN2_9ACTN|nr:Clp protease [Mangrovihabitans endophyticus]